MKARLVTAVAILSLYAVAFGIAGGCNRYWNNKEIKKPGVHAISRGIGLSGHKEYVRFSDGSEEVKVYHSLGHKSMRSYTYYNTNGDDSIDRIRVQGSVLGSNRLVDLMMRETDYQENEEEFDKADKVLLEERTKAGY